MKLIRDNSTQLHSLFVSHSDKFASDIVSLFQINFHGRFSDAHPIADLGKASNDQL